MSNDNEVKVSVMVRILEVMINDLKEQDQNSTMLFQIGGRPATIDDFSLRRSITKKDPTLVITYQRK